jgi:hypothetical protein
VNPFLRLIVMPPFLALTLGIGSLRVCQAGDASTVTLVTRVLLANRSAERGPVAAGLNRRALARGRPLAPKGEAQRHLL